MKMNVFYCMMFACLLIFNMQLYSQGFQVSGTVYDENGEPLPGVSVQVKGVTLGTISDAKGNYTITAPNDNAVLLFTFGGYHQQEIPVGYRPITMAPLTVANIPQEANRRRQTDETSEKRQETIPAGALFNKGKKVYQSEMAMNEGYAKYLLKMNLKTYNELTLLSRKDVRYVMANTNALQMYNKSVKRNRNGNIWIIAGGGFIAAGTAIAVIKPFDWHKYYTRDNSEYYYHYRTGLPYYGNGNTYYRYNDKGHEILGLCIATAGGAMIITGAILKLTSIAPVNKSVYMFNNETGKTGMNMDFDFTGNGMRLVLNF